MLESLNLPDVNLMENLSTALAAIAGFALAFGQRLWTGAKQALGYATRPFAGVWLHLRLMVASKTLYDHLYAVLAAEIKASGRNVSVPALDAIIYLKEFGSDLDIPEKSKPKRSSRKRRTGERLTTPAEDGAGETGVKAAPERRERRFTTPAEEEPASGEAVPATT